MSSHSTTICDGIHPESHLRSRASSITKASSNLHSLPSGGFHLCTYDEVPKWQQDNDFIRSGYVKETYSFKECFKSLLYFNNEWVNVITHLIPGSLLPICLALMVPFASASNPNFVKVIPSFIMNIPVFQDSNSMDTLMFGLFFLGFITCLSCSAFFHTIKVHSYKVSVIGSSFDYAGIVVLITTSMIGIIYYSLSDQIEARNFFLVLTLTFGTISMITTWIPQFKTSEWRPYRTAVFISFGLSALFPICFGLYKFGFKETVRRSGFWYVLAEGIGYISGALLYAMRVPERFSPGTFDIFGQSHNIFHVLVVISAFSHFRALVLCYINAHFRSLV